MAHDKMNSPDAFEHAVRKSLETYELPYNSADWSLLEKELDNSSSATRSSSAALIALLFGGTLALATTVYVLLNQTSTGDASRGAGMIVQQTGLPTETGVDNAEALVAVVVNNEQTGAQGTSSSARVGNKANGRSNASVVKSEGGAPVVTPPVSIPPPDTDGHQIGIRSSISEGCPGSSVEFSVANAPDQKDVLWNFGDGSFSTAKNPTHVFSKPGRFEVVLSHSTFLDKPISGVIIIHEQPEAAFKPMMQAYENTIPHYHFQNHSLGGASYSWDFGDGNTSALRLPNHVYKQSGIYTVSLIVKSASGCTDRTERTVRVEDDYNLLAAKTFSPDGDGVEDTFIPEALKTLGLRFRMTVHDPVSGQLVFETMDPKRPWNGRIGGRGEFNAAGKYVWMVEMKDGDKVGGTYTGTVDLIR